MNDGVGREWECEAACQAGSESAHMVDKGSSEFTILFHFIFIERSWGGQLVCLYDLFVSKYLVSSYGTLLPHQRFR